MQQHRKRDKKDRNGDQRKLRNEFIRAVEAAAGLMRCGAGSTSENVLPRPALA